MNLMRCAVIARRTNMNILDTQYQEQDRPDREHLNISFVDGACPAQEKRMLMHVCKLKMLFVGRCFCCKMNVAHRQRTILNRWELSTALSFDIISITFFALFSWYTRIYTCCFRYVCHHRQTLREATQLKYVSTSKYTLATVILHTSSSLFSYLSIYFNFYFCFVWHPALACITDGHRMWTSEVIARCQWAASNDLNWLRTNSTILKIQFIHCYRWFEQYLLYEQQRNRHLRKKKKKKTNSKTKIVKK